MNFDFFMDIFFPPECVCCARRIKRGTICEPCHGNLIARSNPLSIVSDGSASYAVGAAGNYEDPVLQALIHALKFRFIKGAADPLAEMLCSYMKAITPVRLNHFTVVPIPLSRRRERSRGFNQSTLIAHGFARGMNLIFLPNALARIRHRKPQSETKNVTERRENIRGCFSAVPDVCAGKNIILIDDVTTSGATFLEAARALTAAGAGKIIALAVARA
jgi:ComF family protein